MNILALDLGTKTGYCYSRNDIIYCGTWELATAKEIKEWGKSNVKRTCDPRICRLFTKIMGLGPFNLLIFEDVLFASSVYQVQLWAGFRSAIWLSNCLSDWNTIIEVVPTATLKKFATGKGNADKTAMIEAVKRRWPDIWKAGFDDNACDAVALYNYALCKAH
jgi:Holliday junction resolvasome RuvABC endonuclease subunit